ncbi:MAG TPA: AAA family ATPase [Kineosporiaceae bacterium]|nr:AAA family ATPase [Kineosporiaceae bacterium]
MGDLPIFCDPDRRTGEALRDQSGGGGMVFTDLGALRDHLKVAFDEDTIVLGTNVSEEDAFAVAEFLRLHRPSLGVILVRDQVTTPLLQEALRAGLLDVLDSRDGLGLKSAIKRSAHLAAARRDQGPEQQLPTPPSIEQPLRRGRVITVFSAKGGSGKTTLATNLAAVLADRGRRQVCIVDLDLAFGDVAIAMQLFPARTIADAVPLNGAIDSSAVAAMLTHHSAGLSAIVAPTEPSASETIRPSLIAHLLDVLRNDFDYIVVDTPARFDDEVLAALDVSDLVALIVTPDVPALKTLKITLETLIELSYSRSKFRLILNRSDAKVGISHLEVEKTAQMPIGGFIPSSREVPATINRGVLIVQDDPKHPVSLGIRKFAEVEVIGSGVPRVENGEGRGRIRMRRQRS